MKIKYLLIGVLFILCINFSNAEEITISVNNTPAQLSSPNSQVIDLLQAGDIVTLTGTTDYFYLVTHNDVNYAIDKKNCLTNNSSNSTGNSTIEKKTFTSIDGKKNLEYLLYVPENISDTMPLVIFFHGRADGGKGLDHLIANVPLCNKLYTKELSANALILIPQSPKINSSVENILNDTLSLVDRFANGEISDNSGRKLVVDKSRIGVIGFSSGGATTWKAAFTYPDYFKAVVVISDDNYVHEAQTLKLAKVKAIWAFAGIKEKQYSTNMSKIVNKINSKSGNAKFTTYNANHSTIQNEVFKDNLILDWIAEQVK